MLWEEQNRTTAILLAAGKSTRMGASVDKASIGNVFLGVILFHLMFIVAPKAGAAITGDSMIGEYFRVFVSYAVITVALVMYETAKRRDKQRGGEELQQAQQEEGSR